MMVDIIRVEEARKESLSMWRKILVEVKAPRPEAIKSRMRNMLLHILIDLSPTRIVGDITATTADTVTIITSIAATISIVENLGLSD